MMGDRFSFACGIAWGMMAYLLMGWFGPALGIGIVVAALLCDWFGEWAKRRWATR